MTESSRPERAEVEGRVMRELAVVHQLAATRLNRALRPLELTLTHAGLLFHLSGSSDGCSIAEIAAAMEVNQPAVSKTVRSLAERGAVTVDTPADDGRRRTVRLTSLGTQLLTEAKRAMHPETMLTFAALTDMRLADLLSLLAAIRTHLDDARLADGRPGTRVGATA